MPKDVELSLLTAGGIAEPNAAWTAKAKQNIGPALREILRQYDVELIEYETKHAETDLAQRHEQLVKLHSAVGNSILIHKYNPGLELPTKIDKFDWSLGREAIALKDDYGADYALFIFLRDRYASAGRAMVIIAGAILGVGLPGGAQVGFASLVDLNTGEVVWFNRLARAQGDLREPAAAKETITALLNEFPR
jgi:hypothetical protein